MIFIGLNRSISGWLYVLIAGFGHTLTKDRLSTALLHYDLVWLDDRLLSFVLWLFVSAFLCRCGCVLQPHETSKAPLPTPAATGGRAHSSWRTVYLVSLVLVGVGGFTLFGRIGTAFLAPNLTVTPCQPTCTPPWESLKGGNLLGHDLSSTTVWSGTRVVRPVDDLDQGQSLSPDLHYTLRLCGGMPKRQLTNNSMGHDSQGFTSGHRHEGSVEHGPKL